ncbi:1-acyl-sn-glycerol-3-phosphate acyltransferase [Massilia glaciei]|uniref:Glycerol acyltransferase n=1 Tax=Massilia glaciei TaxID=1524097 RepID=A0A2U2HFS2_9BURK|nr:1-acyl-sn-glycerol-3-phosphate acyltransferase [Massilia glaciei]PWF43384.1 glycerol acyltransferase [Massilia glaciei]
MDEYLLDTATLATFGQRSALRVLRLFGWRVRFKPLPGPRGVAVVYPHTSNWDFFLGLFGKWAIGVPFRWLGKEALFKGWFGKLFGPMLRSWGGVPVERASSTGATRRLANTMLAADWFWLALAPEGTRSYRDTWRSGFYHLTVMAKVPLRIVYFDYPNKEIGVIDTLTLSGEPARDMAAIAAAYHGHLGLHPELAAPIALAPPRREPRREDPASV